ncbi:MAG TPA: MFS transporter [Candidatus Dormibacteraeota bacterium]|nr:MFS transporter [Candidatus Dormibacteraeota bacterium]
MRATRFVIALFFFADGLLLGSWASRIPAVQQQAGLTNTQLGLGLFASSLGALVAMPLAGRLCERVGSRRVVIASLLVEGLSLVAASTAAGLTGLALALLGFGAGFGAINVAVNAQGIALERVYGRTILSSFHAAFSLGGLVGAACGALAAGLGVTPRAHLGALAVAVAVAAAVLGRKLLAPTTNEAAPARTTLRPPRLLLILGAAAFCSLLAEGSAADWSGPYLSQSAHATAWVAGLGYAAFSLAMATSRTLGDRLARRLGPVALARAGGLVAALGLTAGLLAGSAPVGLAGFAAMGAGLGVVVPLLFRAAGSTPGVSTSVGVATVSTIGWLGFLAGPPAIGFTAGAVGLRAALFIVVAVIASLLLLARSAAPRADDAARSRSALGTPQRVGAR